MYFVSKIVTLKNNIDKTLMKDPLEKIKQKMSNKNLTFSLKTVSEFKFQKAMKAISKKKSKGNDGISLEFLLLGTDVLAKPLTSIINESIKTGIFSNGCLGYVYLKRSCSNID